MSTELQERITRNVRILMAVQAITDQKTLAARLKWGADKLTRSLRGERRWAVADLQELADVFGVRPGDMLADAATLVTATVPSRTGTEGSVSAGVSGRCPRTNPRIVIPFPQAGRMRRGYHSRQAIAIKRGVRPPAAENNGHPYAAPVA
jgi:hypothetical protein